MEQTHADSWYIAANIICDVFLKLEICRLCHKKLATDNPGSGLFLKIALSVKGDGCEIMHFVMCERL